MKIVRWTEAYACEAATGRCEPSYDFGDLASDPADAAETRGTWRPATFREVARGTRRFELVGGHEFLRMERPA